MKGLCIALLGIFFSVFPGNAQPDITLGDIWGTYRFNPRSVPGFNFNADGRHYTRLEENRIVQYDLTTGASTRVLFDAAAISHPDFKGDIDDYSFSGDEERILIQSESRQIYRRSKEARFFVYDRESGELSSVFREGSIRYATFSPGGDKLAFVYQNNLFYRDLNSGLVRQISTDGRQNEIINGATDWVYEEEFGFSVGFQWSPDGQYLAYYRFDEKAVPEFTVTNYRNELYPEYITYKYPKVGAPNATVSILICQVATGQVLEADTRLEEDHYIPRIKWTKAPGQLCILRMNRHQNELELLLADATTGKTRLLMKETNPYYLDENLLDNLTFLRDGQHFLWTSEKDGWTHLYLYDMQGREVRQLTSGPWDLTGFYGIDEERGRLYYQAAGKSPLQRQIYSIDLQGGNKLELAGKAGWNSAQFSSTFDYFVLNLSTANSPSSYTVFDRNGRPVRLIEDNAGLRRLQADYQVQPVEFFGFTTSEDVTLNGWMIKPRDFNPALRYPVFMFLYGGPGSQQVTDSWKGQNYWWFQMLAQQGFLVACVDNRGTGARGQTFKKMTYLQLGHYETIDQIEAARYLGRLPYADSTRIGIFGWSYGGYMSSLCLLKGNDVFKAAIAVAPVTNWRWYDSIYTERFMRTEAENPEGYRQNSPVYFADRLQGDYLLVHGMGDDNVHFQHTSEMANALIAANKQFDTYFYPNRNHGISGGPTRLHLYTKMTNFLQEKLKGNTGSKKGNNGSIKIIPVDPQKGFRD